jgi:polyhydroxybutyrate depolymerase
MNWTAIPVMGGVAAPAQRIRQALPLLVLCALPMLLPCQKPGNQKAGTQKAGTLECRLEVDGRERDYLIHVPKSYKARKDVPLVLMLHGRGSSSGTAARRYGWSSLANKKGFIAVFPSALGSPRSWKPVWGKATTADSTFLAKLIRKVVEDYKIDKDRMFMTGHSSGAIMSFSFAATHSDQVAAIGTVAGTIGWTAGGRKQTIPKPKGPVSVISFHGMADSIVPYDREHGRQARYDMLVSAPESVAFFARHNGCTKAPERRDIHDGRIHIDTWTGGRSGTRVVFYSIERGSHMWPGGRRGGVNATELIWKFFEQHPRRPARQEQPKQAKKAVIR